MNASVEMQAAEAAARIHMPLRVLRPSDSQIRMIKDFPHDSQLLEEWIGTEGGTLVFDTPAEESLANDPDYREGHILASDGSEDIRFKYRAENSGRAGQVWAVAAGWLLNERAVSRGWLSGEVSFPEER